MRKELVKYIDKYGGFLLFFPIVFPVMILLFVWCYIGGKLYDLFYEYEEK